MANILDSVTRRLAQSGSESPHLDAMLLLEYATGWSRSALLAHPERQPSYEQMEIVDALVGRREQHEPMAYLLGQREFYGRPFITDRRALIPRPETELLVDLGKRAVATWRERGIEPVVVEVGTGTGAIAVSVAAQTGCSVIATDVSESALSLARENVLAQRQETRVELLSSDLLAALSGPIHVLLANLPYIPADRKLPPDVAEWEPHLALVSGPTGLELNERLLHEAVGQLVHGSEVGLEMDEGQGTELGALAFRLYPGSHVEVLRDAAGLERVVHVRLAG